MRPPSFLRMSPPPRNSIKSERRPRRRTRSSHLAAACGGVNSPPIPARILNTCCGSLPRCSIISSRLEPEMARIASLSRISCRHRRYHRLRPECFHAPSRYSSRRIRGIRSKPVATTGSRVRQTGHPVTTSSDQPSKMLPTCSMSGCSEARNSARIASAARRLVGSRDVDSAVPPGPCHT